MTEKMFDVVVGLPFWIIRVAVLVWVVKRWGWSWWKTPLRWFAFQALASWALVLLMGLVIAVLGGA